MAEKVMLSAETRRQTGTRAVKKLRAAGKIPAVVYGHQQDTVAICVVEDEVQTVLRKGAHGLLELDVEGQKQSVLIKDVQWDAFGQELLHLDFARVSADESVMVEVPIVLRGTAPGLREGGVLDQPLHAIELECPAANIQENVVVNINELGLEQAILVRDLELAQGVKATADPEQVVIQVKAAAEEEEPEEGALEGPAEPEVIRREGKEAEEAES